MQFLKNILSSMVGSLIAFFLFGIISVIVIMGIAVGASKSLTQKPATIKDNSVLTLSLNYSIAERSSNNIWRNINFNTMEVEKTLGLYEIKKALNDARYDASIKGIFMDLSSIGAGIATVDDIRNEILNFKQSGKFVIAFGETYSQKAYYLATAADEIYITPQGFLQFNGLSTRLMYLKGTLEKLGVEAQIFRGPNNEYKSAVEIFTNDKMSDKNREQVAAFVDDIWSNMLEGIASARGISKQTAFNAAENFQLYPTNNLIEAGLITKLIYREGVLEILKERLAIAPSEKIASVKLENYYQPKQFNVDNKKPKIAVVFANGEMMVSTDDPEQMNAKQIAKTLRKIRKDTSIKAVVLRINSGGGSALAAEIIHHEAELTAQAKPLIASFGDIAASGGYYMAAPAQKIIAQRNTITGSIGVYGMIPNMQKLFNQKLGVTFDGVKTNKFGNLFVSDRALNNDERMLLNNMVANTYNIFLDRVAKGRNMELNQVKSIAGGRVWSATDAKNIGLVDRYGDVNTSIEEAAAKAGVMDYSIETYPKHEDLFKSVFKGMSTAIENKMLSNRLGMDYKLIKVLKTFNEGEMVYTRIPYNIALN